jgi:mxaJ protein
MFLRFLKNLAAKKYEKTRKNFRKTFVLLRGFSRLILFSALFLVSCTKSEPPVATQKHYIEPPQQQKIPASKIALRVCADPNNLPFSNEKREGFENKIAELIGREMRLPVEYTWWAQRRGFFRNTLRAGLCDVVIGVPASFELALTTVPYYRSTYVFVSRRDRNLNVKSLDDKALKELKIGVQMIGDDFTNAPPAHALSNRGITKNLVGYTVYGDYKQANPPARIIDAVVERQVDLAIVWGPLAGFFAKKEKVPLEIVSVSPQIDLPYLPFVFDISMGVRRGEDELKGQLEEILARRRGEIEKILNEYGVPRADSKEIALNREGS